MIEYQPLSLLNLIKQQRKNQTWRKQGQVPILVMIQKVIQVYLISLYLLATIIRKTNSKSKQDRFWEVLEAMKTLQKVIKCLLSKIRLIPGSPVLFKLLIACSKSIKRYLKSSKSQLTKQLSILMEKGSLAITRKTNQACLSIALREFLFYQTMVILYLSVLHL